MRRIVSSAPRVSSITRRLLCSEAAPPSPHVTSAQAGQPSSQVQPGIGASPIIWAVSSNLDAPQKPTTASLADAVQQAIDGVSSQHASDSTGTAAVSGTRKPVEGAAAANSVSFTSVSTITEAPAGEDVEGPDVPPVVTNELNQSRSAETSLPGSDIHLREDVVHIPGQVGRGFVPASADELCEEMKLLSRRNAFRHAGHLFGSALKRNDPDLVNFLTIRTALPILSRLMWAKTIVETLEFMSEHNIDVPTPVYNCAFAGLTRDGRVAEIEKTIEKMWTLQSYSQPNAASYTYLISAYFCKGDMDKAFGVLQEMKNRMIYPSFGTYQTLIAGCIRMGAPRRSFETLLAVEQQRFEMSALTIGQVMVACAEADDLQAVTQLIARFDDALVRYSSDIERLSARRNIRKGNGPLNNDRGVGRIGIEEPKLEIAGLMSLLHAAYRGARPDIAERAMSWFAEWYPDYRPPPSAWYCVVGAHSFAGNYAASFDTVSRMRAAGYTPTLIELHDSLVKPLSTDLEKVDEQFYRLADKILGTDSRRMNESHSDSAVDDEQSLNLEKGPDDLEGGISAPSEPVDTRPDDSSVSSTSGEVSDVADPDESKTSLGDVIRSRGSESVMSSISNAEADIEEVKLDVGIEELNCIIAACSQAGDLERAFQTYDEAQRCGLTRNVETFNALLSGCVVTRHVKGGIRVVEEMKELGVAINQETVHLLTRLFMRIGHFNKALQAVEDATEKGVELSTSTFQTLTRKLMRLGRLAEVRTLIALAERSGISSEAVVARVEGAFVRDLAALDGDLDVLHRSPDSAQGQYGDPSHHSGDDGDLHETSIADEDFQEKSQGAVARKEAV
jgi:pentatricopeptide repeat protein